MGPGIHAFAHHLQDNLREFYAVHAPDQMESAGQVAAMFADDVPALQKLLMKKYEACLAPAQMPCFTRVPSTGEEVQGLIDAIESSLFSDSPLDLVDVDARVFGSNLQLLNAPTGLRHLIDFQPGGNGGAGWTQSPDVGGGFLDAMREKIEMIALFLPLRPIPLDCLSEMIDQMRGLTRGQGLDVAAGSVEPDNPGPVLHAILAECKVLNLLLETVHGSLRQMDMALLRNSPLGGSKAQARECAKSLISGKVPAEWISCSFPTTKSLAVWLQDLSENRLPQVTVWRLCRDIMVERCDSFTFRLAISASGALCLGVSGPICCVD